MSSVSPPRSLPLLVGYAALVATLVGLMLFGHAPIMLAFLLIAPGGFAALFYPRRVFLTMIALGACGALIVLGWRSTEPRTLSQILAGCVLIQVLLAEITHRLIAARARIEGALQESEERYHQMFENSKVAALLLDPVSGAIVDANRAACAFYGYSREELLSKRIFDINIHSDEQIQAELVRAATDQLPYLLFQHRLASGNVRDVEVHIGPILVHGQRLLYAIIHDITERRQAERRGTAISALGHQLSAATTAEGAARIILAVADELVGWDACSLDLYDAETDMIHPVLVIDEIDGRRTVLPLPDQGHPPSPFARTVLTQGARLLLRDAAPTDVGLRPFGDTGRPSASLMFAPIRSGDRSIGFLSIQSYTPYAYTQTDLDLLQSLADHCGGALQRTLAAERLRVSEERYRALSELTSDCIYIADVGEGSNWTVVWATESFVRLTGYTLAELDAHGGWMTLVYPDDLAIAQRWQQRLLEGEPSVAEFRILTRSNDIRWLRDYARPERDPGCAQIVRFLGAIQDITERKRSEEGLLHRQKLESLGVLAGGIAHDFNNLLMSVQGNAVLALRDLSPESPAYASIEQILVAAQRAADLTRQMLAYAGKGHFTVCPLDLNTVADELTQLMQVSIARHVTIRYQLAMNLPLVMGDAAQLGQMIVNLVINASEAISDQEGTITLSTGVLEADRAYFSETYLAPELPLGTYVYLSVADTGCGMSQTTMAQIFEPFFTTKFIGRGLGLAAVLGIVRAHHGAIKVQSEIGRGSTFTVVLPVTDQPAQLIVEQPIVKPIAADAGKILVIDDEPGVRAIAARMLERVGYQVLTAGSGHEGVEIFERHTGSIFCVLLDLSMPDMDGEQTLRELRKLRPHVQVILMSGFNEQPHLRRLQDQGPTTFLQKPFSAADLRERVRQALQDHVSLA